MLMQCAGTAACDKVAELEDRKLCVGRSKATRLVQKCNIFLQC